jgi:hypothetical protein
MVSEASAKVPEIFNLLHQPKQNSSTPLSKNGLTK